MGKSDCIGTYMNGQGMQAPKVWAAFTSNYDNIFACMETLFQVMSLDGWKDICLFSMDITSLDMSPSQDSSPLAAVFYIIFVFVGSILITQLFVAVIIESYIETQRLTRSEDQMRYYAVLTMVTKMWGSRDQLNTRPDNCITGLCHDIFTDCYPKRTCDKGYLHILHRNIDAIILTLVLTNGALMCSEHSGQSEFFGDFLEYQNLCFLALFTVESFMKILAYGFSYFQNAWHLFDFCIVAGGWFGILAASFGLAGFYRIFRVARALRVVRAARHAKQLKSVFETLIGSVVNVGNIIVLLLVLFFMWSVVGMQTFGTTKFSHGIDKDQNFSTFFDAYWSVMRVATGAYNGAKLGASVRPPDCTEGHDCGIHPAFANLYFMLVLITAFYIGMNLFIAVIMENFVFTYTLAKSSLQQDLRVTEADLDHLMKCWDFFDPTHCGRIEVWPNDVCSEMAAHIGPPLGKKMPVPDYWLESLRLQLLRKSKKNRLTGARQVELKTFVMCLVTRAMGIASMTDAERDAYLEWIRSTANSQLACLIRDMLRNGNIRRGAEMYKLQCLEDEKKMMEQIVRLREERAALCLEEQIELLLARSDREVAARQAEGEEEAQMSHRRELTMVREEEAAKRNLRILADQERERKKIDAAKVVQQAAEDALHGRAEWSDTKRGDQSNEQQAHVMHRRMDVDGDGQLDEVEFMMSAHKWGITQDRAKELFHIIDKDHTGTIDEAEVVKAMKDNLFALGGVETEDDKAARKELEVAAIKIQSVHRGRQTRLHSPRNKFSDATKELLSPRGTSSTARNTSEVEASKEEKRKTAKLKRDAEKKEREEEKIRLEEEMAQQMVNASSESEAVFEDDSSEDDSISGIMDNK